MSEETKKFDVRWLAVCSLITAVSVLLRFYDLALKPMHHDEGVNGWFLTTLFNDGVYRYDPANYHGPTIYYISLLFAKIFGLEIVPLRASVAVFGVLMVVLVLYLRRYIGGIGAAWAALLVALSPGMVYISRYFIHEIFFVFLALAFVVSILFFIDQKKAGPGAVGWMALLLSVCLVPFAFTLAAAVGGSNVKGFQIVFVVIAAVLAAAVTWMLAVWDSGRPIYLLLASASVSLMFATKETAFITIGTMLIALVCIRIYRAIRGSGTEMADELTLANFREGLGSGMDLVLIVVACVSVFVFVFVLFFSSFFTYPEGVRKAFEAYAIWTKTGGTAHTQNGFFGYWHWGMRIEAPIFIVSAIGIAAAFIKGNNRFAMFASLWAFGLFAAYSIIPYKTPWLALSFILPMCIAGGYGINELMTHRLEAVKAAGAIVITAAVAVLSYQMYELNFVRYDDNSDETVYVYAHTKREFLELVEQIHHYSRVSGKGEQASIQVVSPDYWPLVWDLRNYPRAAFSGHVVAAQTAEIIIAKKGEQDAAVEQRYSANYTKIGTYALRPGVDLVLLVRNDIAEK